MASIYSISIPLLLTLIAADDNATPEIIHLGMVSPGIVGITIQAGHIEYGEQLPYQSRPGDQLKGNDKDRRVIRQGAFLGWLVGRDGDIVHSADRLVGMPLDTATADRPTSYAIQSSDDLDFAMSTAPVAVFRKSKPSDFGRQDGWPYLAPIRHVIYLKFGRALEAGCSYQLTFEDDSFAARSFRFVPESQRSEAVHVSHLGFRPDDPVKRAFLSCWLGTGGPLIYQPNLQFALIDERSNAVVLEGQATLANAGSDKNEDAYQKNYAAVDVFEMDFSEWSHPGVFRVSVEGVGCSYPFRIDDSVWQDAFTVSARGFYHQRSGIELGPPYTKFSRPRCFHPADNVVVVHSSCPLMESGNGINALGTDEDNFGNLNGGRTDEQVQQAWGGYMDAGDWDRRIQHLIASRYLIELADLFPETFDTLTLNIPESQNELPDVLDEALFNLDCYRRMQTAAGGIRGGIESAEHPRYGEGSWQESLDIMAYAPGIWSSYIYAGVAAQAARTLTSYRARLAAVYHSSALRAMQWAEEQFAGLKQTSKWSEYGEPAKHQIRDERNLAAAELFRLTGDPRWHQIFQATTKFLKPSQELAVWQSHDQREAAWVYLQTQHDDLNSDIQENCRLALLREADDRFASTRRSGFRYAKQRWGPGAWGAFSAPDGVSLVRAHRLTHAEKYLQAAILACQHGAGANPVNLCYTTGVGHDSPQHPLHIDSRITHQPAPSGFTVFGPADVELDKENWAQKIVARYCHPDVQKWPSLEAFWDVFWYPSMCEFTVHQPMARNAYVWGYLAARQP